MSKSFQVKTTYGFTLIELMVVIAIIGVLGAMIVVIVNPLERVRAANDRRAASNLRSVGTALSTCTTKELELGSSGFPYGPKSSTFTNPHTIPDTTTASENGCGNFTWMSSASKRYTTTTRPNGITILNNGSANPTRICAWVAGGSPGGVANWWIYSSSQPQVRSVTTNPTTVSCGSSWETL